MMKRFSKTETSVRQAWFAGVVSVLAGLGMLACSTSTVMADPLPQAISPISIVGIDEWNVPVFKKPVNLFMQTGVYWSAHDYYNGNADRNKFLAGNVTVAEGVTRFAHAWAYSDKVGAFWEILVPEVWFKTNLLGTESGIGDPFLDYTLYMTPNDHTMIGGQVFIQIPIGGSEAGGLTNWTGTRAWVAVPNLIGQYRMNGVAYQWTVGAAIPFGADHGLDPSNSYFAQTSVRYEVMPNLQVGVTNIIQYTASGDYGDAGLPLGTSPGIDKDHRGNAYQDEVGPGFKYDFRPGTFLSGQYYFGVSGKNAIRANELSLRFVQAW